MSSPTAWVYVDLDHRPRLVGRLFVTSHHGRETATFVYDDHWIQATDHFALQPALTVSRAPHYAGADRGMFGALGASAPDRWGQTLMRREERRRAKAEGRAPRALRAIDFLLGVTDSVRQGARRLSHTEHGPFVAPERPLGVPPLVDLPKLLAASERFLSDDESAEDLRLLLAPGSSLGGARPKASVRDATGALFIAKFPKRAEDDHCVVAWESVALQLAREAGVYVTDSRFERIGATDGERRSYPEIADVLRRHGSRATDDLAELWRRMVFSVLISNTDDHLRNHGFLHEGVVGWRLSPAFDLNPVPTDIAPRFLATSLDVDGDPTASLEIALSVAEQFGLEPDEASGIAGEVGRAVRRWRSVATQHGISSTEIDRMESAFEHHDLQVSLAC